MTIIDILNNHASNNQHEIQALEIIRDSYIGSVNNNYTLIVDHDGKLLVRIPSMEKRDEFVYKEITEYDYPLVMCMNVEEINNPEYYSYIQVKFLEVYKDRLQVFFKDVHTVDKLKKDIVETKKKIEFGTYATITGVILSGLSLCLFNISNSTTKNILVLGIILFFCCSLYLQFTKDTIIKKLIDGYISTIHTDWYNSELRKHYTFLCNFMG
ncbi:hypothetical protein [uncultured Clostridium sp.]|uniref:hypothetical protein n=1 Tax=uncultured Clostridium sp. TaxID=59620 RepID=UPI0025DB319E|nr:hypothetical protein [uncultured Clostridium sp.]